jgi:hypothetical protein
MEIRLNPLMEGKRLQQQIQNQEEIIAPSSRIVERSHACAASVFTLGCHVMM